MKEFFFQNILIADISKKVAKWQQFTKGLNVVTGIDNHVGKSSLLKSLFYALGADVAFDSAWDQNSKKLLLEQDYIEHKKEISTWFELLKK